MNWSKWQPELETVMEASAIIENKLEECCGVEITFPMIPFLSHVLLPCGIFLLFGGLMPFIFFSLRTVGCGYILSFFFSWL